jgi:hypothetical protein
MFFLVMVCSRRVAKLLVLALLPHFPLKRERERREINEQKSKEGRRADEPVKSFAGKETLPPSRTGTLIPLPAKEIRFHCFESAVLHPRHNHLL